MRSVRRRGKEANKGTGDSEVRRGRADGKKDESRGTQGNERKSFQMLKAKKSLSMSKLPEVICLGNF